MYQGMAVDISAVAEAPFVASITASTVTIQAPDGNLSASGGASGVYVNVSGLVDIDCLDYPSSKSGAWADERNTTQMVESLAYRIVLLRGFYEQLSPDTNWGDVGWIAVVTGPTGQSQTYDVRGAGCDNNQTQTWIRLRVVTV